MSKKQRIGTVISSKPDKTIIVGTQIRYRHPKYEKVLIKTRRFMAHDEKNQCKRGDLVLIQEGKPISRCKTWVLKEILSIIKRD